MFFVTPPEGAWVVAGVGVLACESFLRNGFQTNFDVGKRWCVITFVGGWRG